VDGLILSRGEIGNLITALDLAIAFCRMNIRYERIDREDSQRWNADLKVFRRLCRKLAKF